MGVAVLVLGCLGIGAWWHWRDGATIQYQSEKLERGPIESTVSATGNCNAVVSVQVGSQVSGNIKELYADFNTKVTKGQLVALIDPEIFQAKVNQAKANLQAAQAAVETAKATQIKADADLAGARSGLANAEANAEKAKVAVADARNKLNRQQALFEKKLIAKDDLETFQATSDSSKAALEAANAQIESAKHTIESSLAQGELAKAQLKTATAQTAQMQAQLDQAEIDLKHTEIKAPVDGTVIARRMDAGQTVAASFQAPTLFEIAQDLTKMQVDANIDEADIGRVKLGQKATFTVDAYPGERFVGKVTQIRAAPINTQNVVTYDVVIEVPNPEFKLFPGMTANVRILVDRREDALKLPNAALRVKLQTDTKPSAPAGTAGGGASAGAAKGPGASSRSRKPLAQADVWVLASAGDPKAIKTQLGLSDGSYTEVTGGDLKEGDAVIVSVINKKATPTPTGAPGSPRTPRF